MSEIRKWEFSEKELRKAIGIYEKRKKFGLFSAVLAFPSIVIVFAMLFFKFAYGSVPQNLIVAGFAINLGVFVIYSCVIYAWFLS